MDIARWNDKELNAPNIENEIRQGNIHLEKQIRLLSEQRKLRCPNPECSNPIVIFRRGPEKVHILPTLIQKI